MTPSPPSTERRRPVGSFTRQQVADYAARTGLAVEVPGLVDAAVVPALTEHGSPGKADARAEKFIQRDIARALKQAGYLHVWHRLDKPTGGTLGTPDFLVFLEGGRCCLLEVKTATGKLSPWQKEFAARCARKRVPCFTVRSVCHAMECVRAVERTGK